MVTTDTALEIRNLTIDYSTGHVLIDGRPIGTFVAEQGPEVLASPAPDLYVVNIPLLVKSVTFLPSGEHFTPNHGINAAWNSLAKTFQSVLGNPDPRVPVSDVRLALAQNIKDRRTIERVMVALDEVAP